MLAGMRALVVYESIFGNTRQIAEAIGEGLRGGLEVEVVEVGEAPPPADDVDLVVVGGPTHVWGMSRGLTRRGAGEQARQQHKEPISRRIGVREWLRTLRRARGRRLAAAFDTAIRSTGSFPTGSAARAEAARLEDRGYGLVSEPEQFFVADVDGPLEAGEVERARAWGVRLAARARDGAVLAPRTRWRPSESVGEIVANVFGLVLVNMHEVWRPLTLGVVTAAWSRTVETISLACVVAITGHAILLVFRSRLLQPLVGCAIAAASLAAATVVYAVFPFDFGAIELGELGWLGPMFELILLVALIGAAIGLAVRIVRLVIALARG